MDKRRETLSELHTYIEGVDKEITMILQSLQWDRKHLLEGGVLVSCKYDANHRVPPDKKAAHEKACLLRSQGYAPDDVFLPEPLDDNAPTLVKLSKEDITQIINTAANADPSFVRGPGCSGNAPLTAERLQASFTADERRALYDAVVAAAPDTDCAVDLALPGTSDEAKPRPKSKVEVLAELRDMRRRRTKYRSSGATKNYSNVLRDVIKTQMELFIGVKEEPEDPTHIFDNTRESVDYKHASYKERDDGRRKYGEEHKTERYDNRSNHQSEKYFDNHKGKHRGWDDKNRGKPRQRERCDNETSTMYIKIEPEEDYNINYEESKHTSYKSRKKDHDRRDSDRKRNSDRDESSRRYNRDDSEVRSEKSYRSQRSCSSSSRSMKRHREIEREYVESRSTKRYWDCEDDSKPGQHHESKYKDSHSYEKKRKR